MPFWRRTLGTLRKLLILAGLSLGFSFLFFHVLSRPFQVYGSSMAPTLSDGDYLLVARTFSKSSLRRGDLVVFKPSSSEPYLVKRVVALQGDRVEEWRGSLLVNGRAVASVPGLLGGSDLLRRSWTVPSGALFCLGDNPGLSRDSRVFGPVDAACVFGRPIFCYLPLGRCRWIGGGQK